MFIKLLSIVCLIPLLTLSEHALAYNRARCDAFHEKYGKGDFVGGTYYSSTTSFITSTGPCAAIGQREQRDVFVAHNSENLKIDSARGGGESIDAVAELSGCYTEESKKLFFNKLQRNFESVFYNGPQDSSSEEITKRIDTIISSTPKLNKVCKIKG